MNSVPFQYADVRGVIITHNVNEKSTFNVEYLNGKKETISYDQFRANKNLKKRTKNNTIVQVHGVKE